MSTVRKKRSFLSPQENRALAEFKAQTLKIVGKQGCELRLFGSRARGEGDEDSDLDVLILLNVFDHETKKKILDAAYHVFAETDILISAHVLSKAQFNDMYRRERLIALEIEKDGITL